jgi:hypothetical protein
MSMHVAVVYIAFSKIARQCTHWVVNSRGVSFHTAQRYSAVMHSATSATLLLLLRHLYYKTTPLQLRVNFIVY